MVSQGSFAKALLDPELPVPDGLRIGSRPAGERFDVYRNNVVAGLADVLASGFPALVKLLGDEFFRAMAAEFVRRNPPQSPVLMWYGGDMPDFLAGFPPVQGYPYLPDVARLELAIRASYHAEDAQSVTARSLQGMSESDIENARLELSPAVFQLRSDYPVRSIWMANLRGRDYSPSGGEDVLVVRKEFDPEPMELAPGGFEFIEAVRDGQPLASASETALYACPEFDLSALFGLLLASHAITALGEP